MVYIRTEEEIVKLKRSSLLVGKTLAEVAKHIKPGVETIKLDALAEKFIRDHHAEPGFKGYHGYPNSLCISVNNEVVHGIPGNRILESGDIVSVDCGVLLNGFYGDSAYTFCVGEVDENIKNLLKVTYESLYKGIEMAVAGNSVGDIGFVIQKHVEANGYSVVRDLVGHGIGENLHEDPQIPNYGKRHYGYKLKEGMVICIEPMINMGKKEVYQANDGWTYVTSDGLPSAHFEHQLIIRKNKAEVISTFKHIEEVIELIN